MIGQELSALNERVFLVQSHSQTDLKNTLIVSLPGKQVLKADTSLKSPLPQALMAATRNL